MGYKICIVGEAWGAEEAKARAPFVGASGQELTRMLAEAGIHRADCFLTNVFNIKPEPTNDIENLCDSKSGAVLAGRGPLKAGKFIRAQYAHELERLDSELREVKANITIALGNTAAWFLLGTSGVSKIRGTVTESRYGKVLPTYHPAAILREWSLRPVTVLDLAKAGRESEYSDIRRLERTVYMEPSLDDLGWFFETHLRSAGRIAEDIETFGNQITCIGFAPSPSVSIVVPFVDNRKPGNSYWPTLEHELAAWRWVKKVNALPAAKTFQNGLYDMNFLWHYGVPINNPAEDTMLLHHALQPESEKGLAFLGSVYTNEASWKLRFRQSTIKRDS